MTTITLSTAQGVTLTPATYTSPVVIAAGVTLGGGIASSYAFAIRNDGTIAAADIGVALRAGGTVTNLAGGAILSTTAIHSAVYVTGGAGTVVNAGAITGDGASGVDLNDGGAITNQAGGTIGSGGTHTAVYGAGAPVNITNAGAIGGINLLSGGTVTNTGAITRDGLGVYIAGAAGTVINAGAIAGTGSGSTSAVLLPQGYANRVIVDPGASFLGVVSGGNTAGGAIVSTLELASATSSGTLTAIGTQFLDFGAIELDAGAQWSIAGDQSGLAVPITGFTAGDTIVMTGVTATQSSFSGGILTLDQSTGATLDLPGPFTPANFTVSPISGGTEVTFAPCFRAGTRILTARGELPVEALAIGDLVATAFGPAAPIAWIGHRTLDCRRHPRPHDVLPVRIAAGAFGAGMPQRDLWLSPDHAVWCDGVLIPIRYLVNGATINQDTSEKVTYWHVELPRHGVLLAEGLPCESYLDTGNRGAFAAGIARPVSTDRASLDSRSRRAIV